MSYAHYWCIFSMRRVRSIGMIHWPELLRDMEHWADGFLTGAAAALLIAIGAATIVLFARAI